MAGGGQSVQQVPAIKPLVRGAQAQMGLLGQFQQQPLLAGASNIAQGMAAQLPSLTGPLSSILTNLPSIEPQVSSLQDILTNLPSVSGQVDPLQAALNRNAGIVSTGGALTPTEAASLNAPLSAELGEAGMGRTAPGVFTRALNTYNEMQNRVNTAIGQELQLAPTIENIRAKDAALRATIPMSIEQLRSEDVGLRTQIPSAIQGLETGAQGALTNAELAGVSGLAGLESPFLGAETSIVQANQQAQAANAAAANNKNAGLGSGLLSGLSSIGSASILGNALSGAGGAGSLFGAAAAGV